MPGQGMETKAKGPKRLILLVEDNPDDLALILRAIEHSGLEVNTVVHNEAGSALTWLLDSGRDRYTMPALILLDLSRPQIDGVGFLQRLRADSLSRTIPVVVYSGSTEDSAIAACVASGCNSYVRKPVRYSEFSETVQQIIRYWLVLNE